MGSRAALIMMCLALSGACGTQQVAEPDAMVGGYLSLSWYVNDYTGTCSEAKATHVRLTVERPNGVLWASEHNCHNYSALSPTLPVGPYTVRAFLYDRTSNPIGSSRSTTVIVPEDGGVGMYWLTIVSGAPN